MKRRASPMLGMNSPLVYKPARSAVGDTSYSNIRFRPADDFKRWSFRGVCCRKAVHVIAIIKDTFALLVKRAFFYSYV